MICSVISKQMFYLLICLLERRDNRLKMLVSDQEPPPASSKRLLALQELSNFPRRSDVGGRAGGEFPHTILLQVTTVDRPQE